MQRQFDIEEDTIKRKSRSVRSACLCVSGASDGCSSDAYRPGATIWRLNLESALETAYQLVDIGFFQF